MSDPAKKLLPVVDYLHIPEQGSPWLQGKKCKACSAIFIDSREHCAKCGARHALQPHPLAQTGKLVAFTTVQRSYPGIPVPFTSAIVDLDGGGTVKSNLVGVTDPQVIKAGMAVRLNYEQAPWGDEKGNHYLLFNFKPAGM